MKFEKILSITILALLSTGCSFKNPSQSQTISITVPDTNASSRKSIANDLQMPFLQYVGEGEPVSRAPRPTSRNSGPQASQWSDLTCFAVSVSGPGVPANSNVSCPPGTPSPGTVGGMVPPGGTLSVSVPNGPARLIQLMGFDTTSAVGCPDMANLLQNAGNSNDFNGIDGPYCLGQTITDVFSDVSVSINAVFDSSKKLYDNCGVGNQGPTLAATAALPGNLGGTASGGPVFTLMTPAQVGAGAPEFVSPLTLGGTLSALPSSDHGSQADPLSQGISAITTATGNRAALQLQWNLSGVDTVTYPYIKFNLTFRGGQADSCATSELSGASAGVWDNAAGAWLATGTSSYTSGNNGSSASSGSNLTWSWGNYSVIVPVSQLAITKSDGNKYILLDVESNYTSVAGCSSAVYVATAGMQLYKTAGAEVDQGSGSLQVRANALPGTTGNGYVAQQGSTVSFFTGGGTPPYTYTAAGTGTWAASAIDSTTGILTVPTSGNGTVTVTDSSGHTAFAGVTTMAAGSLLGLRMDAAGSSPTVTAGGCVTLNLDTVTFNGAALPNGSTLMMIFSSITSGSFWGTSGCTSPPVTSLPVSTTTAGPIYFLPTQAGPMYMNPTISGGTSYLSGISSGLTLNVNPKPYVGSGTLQLKGPNLVSSGECVPFLVTTADQYGNPVTPAAADAPSGVSVSLAGVTNGAFFANSNCTGSSTISIPNPSVTPNAIAYFTFTTGSQVSVGGFPTTGTATGGNPSVPSFLPGPIPTVVPASVPVKFVLSMITPPNANGCAQFQVQTTDSYGTTPVNLSPMTDIGSLGMNIIQAPNNATFSDSGCSTSLANVNIGGVAGPTITFYLKASSGNNIQIGNLISPPPGLMGSQMLTVP